MRLFSLLPGRKSLNVAFLVIAISVVCATNLVCQTERVQLFDWKSVNVQGMGYVTGLVIRPGAPYDAYIRTDVGGVYRFEREAARWLPLMGTLETRAGTGTESVAIDASTPQRVYAVINRPAAIVEGKYKYAAEVMVSEDRGLTWRGTSFVKHNIYQGANDDYRVETGERLAVDPHNPNVIYFATRRNGLWRGARDSNGIYAWSQVQGGLPAWKDDPAGYTFVDYDPHGDKGATTQTIYVGVHSSGVWRSTDGGATWTNINGGVDPLRAAVAGDGTLYVSFGRNAHGNGAPATGSVGRYRNGAWADITPADKKSRYTGITVDPKSADTVMVGRDGDVWRSTNAGAQWSVQHMVMHKVDPLAEGSNPSAPAYYLSATAGASGGVAAIVIDPGNPKQVWWTNGWGVARTDDVTAAKPFWAWQMNNLEELCGVMVRVPPKPKAEGGADMVSVVMDMVGFRHASRDEVPETKFSPAGVPMDLSPGLEWQRSMFGGTTLPVPWPHVTMGSSLDYSYHHPDWLAFVGHVQWQAWPIYGYSADNGRTWTAFTSMPTEKLWSDGQWRDATPIAGQIAMSSADPLNMVWAPTWGTFDGVKGSAHAAPWPHYTVDGGRSWKLCKLAKPAAKPDPYDANNNEHVHYDALPRSWANSLHPYLSSNILASDRNDPTGRAFYYFDGTAFYFSEDGAATWSRSAATGFPPKVARVTIASNPARKGDVWLAFARNEDDVAGYKAYHSTDGGRTFATVPGFDYAEKVTFGKGARENQPFIYVMGRVRSDGPDAIYKSEDGGESWIRISDPNTWAMMNVVHMEGDMRTTNLLYLSLDGRGMMYGELK
jgi:hypothetical protein